ncbi:hypothetical protein M8J75_004199 [Diaphorina citri]|nr:hypothetical protein M8J75_004199 [Diaphorina citri]
MPLCHNSPPKKHIHHPHSQGRKSLPGWVRQNSKLIPLSVQVGLSWGEELRIKPALAAGSTITDRRPLGCTLQTDYPPRNRPVGSGRDQGRHDQWLSGFMEKVFDYLLESDQLLYTDGAA